MEVKCEYCGSLISDKDEKCPNCGATNDNFRRSVDGTPKTIEELKQWYIQRKLPPEEVTRFFIGKNISEPRAFGIYEYAGEYIVYKNKDDGSRAIRYQGKDQAYAVNEIYLKMKAEILNQKAGNTGKGGNGKKNNSQRTWIVIAIAIIIFSNLVNSCSHRADGYYNDGQSLYYNYGNTWYTYSTLYDDYVETSEPWFSDSKDDYSVDDSAYSNTTYDFKDSDAWDSIQSSDSDYDWDSGDSWDSGSTDWGSDW